MAASRWTEELLNEASREGDHRNGDPSVHPNADELATAVMTHEEGVHRYNHLLQVADALLAAPSLILTPDSDLRKHLHEFSPEAVRYFEPAPVPAWVDENRLKDASALWVENSVASIAVLYALSLPCTYLYKKGVPALYETGKLTKHDYIFQRIHETGIFVDDVMDTGGLQILADYPVDSLDLHLEVLRDVDPDGDWRLERPGHLLRGAGELPSPDDASRLEARVEEEIARRRSQKRFIWGRGFITARKVRFLHASIRFMLRHPDKMRAAHGAGGEYRAHDRPPQTLTDRIADEPAPWPEEEYGAPINQEELAFGLLSFGYLIPLGLEFLGCRLGQERKENFLHLWKVVGYVMGVREELTTDRWDEATDLLAVVGERQFGHTDFGEHLTVALMAFARSYFPHLTSGLQRRLPAHLIIDQLGRLDSSYPQKVLPADVYADTQRFFPRMVFRALMLWVRFYYTVRDRFVSRIPLLGETLFEALHHASEELIASWKDQFRRKPFDVAGDLAWVKKRGSDPETEKKLGRWRRKMFNNLAFAIMCLFVMVAALMGAGVVTLIPASSLGWDKWALVRGLGLGSVLFGLAGWLWLSWRMSRVFESRPTLGRQG
jgi:hypothetical protein